MIESLENRRLMTAQLVNGVLTITGTEQSDAIVVKQWGSDLLVTQSRRGVPQYAAGFLANDIYLVRVNALGGNDTVTLNIPKYMYTVFTVDGGSGNDRITGGNSLKDNLYGGDGNDTLIGGAGDNRLDGGRGNDLLIGGSGENVLVGGDGNDKLVGGPADDLLIGGNGNDTLMGNGGNDTLRGEAGNDRLYGGAGNDLLSGGAGNDFGDGGAGNDHQDGTVEHVVSIP